MSSNEPSNEPHPKRRRTDGHETEEEAQSSSSSLTRSSYWFDDGNIVLQTTDKQFRVHRSMLSHHSTVFKDMFGIPQPAQLEEPTVEGCPVVHLSDSSKDLENLMSIFYDNVRSLKLHERTPYAKVAAMLRLGTKYDMDHVKQQALDLLHHDHSTKLSEWEKNYNETRIDYRTDDTDLTMRVADLAWEFSLQTILPGAYMVILHDYDLDLLLKSLGQFERSSLSSIKGRDKIIYWLNNNRLAWLRKVGERTFSPQCPSSGQCKSERRKMIEEFGFWVIEDGRLNLFKLADVWTKPQNCSPCSVCLKELEAVRAEIREQAWAALPSFFGLPDWDQLKDGH